MQITQDSTSVAVDELSRISSKDVLLIIGAAAATAVFSQLAVILYNAWIDRKKRRQVREIIKGDIDLVKWNLEKMLVQFQQIRDNIQKGLSELMLVYERPTFNDAIFKAIPLQEVFDAFGKHAPMIASIYNGVTHFTKNSPHEYYKGIFDALRDAGSRGNADSVLQNEIDKCTIHIGLVKQLIKTIETFEEGTR